MKWLWQLLRFLFALSTMSFLLLKLIPGDPVRSMLRVDEIALSTEQLAHYSEQLGLNDTLFVQYVDWLKRCVTFQFGSSYMTQQSVLATLFDRLPNTLLLMAVSLFMMLAVALPAGLLAARFANTRFDRFIRAVSLIGTAIPNFVVGLLLIHVFAVHLQLFPSMGAHVFLPAFTLSLAMMGLYVRMFRSLFSKSLQQPYVQAARARRIRRLDLYVRYVMRDSLAPIVTLLGLSMSQLIAGTVVIEVLFSYPGLGKLAFDALTKRDYPVIQTYFLLVGTTIFIVNSLVDASYSIINPQRRTR